jgi:hypothetical protein
VKLVRLVGFITKKFFTMHGHMNVKKMLTGNFLSTLRCSFLPPQPHVSENLLFIRKAVRISNRKLYICSSFIDVVVPFSLEANIFFMGVKVILSPYMP